ncbi:MMPL family transporter [Actinocatenispora comari]|uniref:MMPL family transporter n=1 Tax=Actinocatenispora comari TaxID=2807577 RepID=UPI001CEDC2BF|nr:MMPL family transporter [Actinocatenispora comari]
MPAALVLVWLVGGGPLGSAIGKLSQVQTNDNAAFLPSSSESTTVQREAARFVDSSTVPAIVVYHRSPKLTDRDLANIRSDRKRLNDWHAVKGQISPPMVSKDGQAVEMVVPLGNGSSLSGQVDTLRSRLTAPDGGSAHVAGPAGLTADLGNAFAGIDGTLLLVTGALVFLILIVVYRSPLLPLVVLATAVLALAVAGAIIYQLAGHNVIDLNGQSQGILFILVIGACTDYALLLVARYREELRRHPDRFGALRTAYRAAVEPIAASGGTVILGVLCLLVTNLKSTQGLGPVAAIGIGASLLAALTFLPAALALLGRAAFWPALPHYAPDHPDTVTGHTVWARIGRWIGGRPRTVWITVALILIALGAAFLPQLKASGTTQTALFLRPQDSVAGQQIITAHFPAGAGNPTQILAAATRTDEVSKVVRGTKGVVPDSVVPVGKRGVPGGPAKVVDGRVLIDATLTNPPDSQAAIDTIQRLRDRLDEQQPSAHAVVGGYTATQADTLATSRRDRTVVIPMVLAVILLVLILLLRALVAPLMLVASVVASFAATLGVSALVFNHLLHFPGADPSVPLFAFVFLVALGVDYNIFLMSRVREESKRGTTRTGTLTALTATGGVITSAGIVLAATFAALAVIPLLFLAQIAFLVAFGVLLDTLLVRTLLVPALVIDVGRTVWWPSRLSRSSVATTDQDTARPARPSG